MFFDVPFKSTLFAKGAQDIYNRCIEILSNLGLPSSHDRPSLFLEGFLLLQISGMVVCDLGNPVIGVGPPLQLRFKLRPMPALPEITVNKHQHPLLRRYNIGLARKAAGVKPVSDPP